MTNTTSNTFVGIVGQSVAKRKLDFYLNGFRSSGVLPHMLFVAPKGCGKTTMAKALAKNLKRSIGEKAKPFIEINCSTIKNVKQFFNGLIIPHVHGKEVTVLFDEASELPRDVTMALLTILNPNPDNRTTFSFENYTVDFDFRLQTFLFATSEIQKVFHALTDRCDRVDLEEYTHSQLGDIIHNNIPELNFEEGVLHSVATVLRGNARAAQKMANNIKNYAFDRGDTFTNSDWDSLTYSLGILPLGLNRIELQILRILNSKADCSLTNLSAKTGLTREAIQRDFELYLQKMNLMEISTSGRCITNIGKTYLEALP